MTNRRFFFISFDSCSLAARYSTGVHMVCVVLCISVCASVCGFCGVSQLRGPHRYSCREI